MPLVNRRERFEFLPIYTTTTRTPYMETAVVVMKIYANIPGEKKRLIRCTGRHSIISPMLITRKYVNKIVVSEETVVTDP